MINDKVAVLFNYNSEGKRRFLIENPISSGGEGLTLHISTTGSILSWEKASDSGNIFEMFAARKMQYTFFIGIYEHDYCRKVYGPFSIKAVENIDTIILEDHISAHFYAYCGISPKHASVGNEGKVICLVNGRYTLSTLFRANIRDCAKVALCDGNVGNKERDDRTGDLILRALSDKSFDLCGRYDDTRSLYDNLMDNEIFGWGLIGNSSIDKYSFAPVMWTSLFRYLGLPVIYKVIHTDDIYHLQKQYDEEIVKMGAMGFNVAMPWKNWAFAQCDWTSASLKRNRTVNTIFKRQRAVFGSNTDGIGLLRIIKQHSDIWGRRFLVLGAGGVIQTLPVLLSRDHASKIYIYDIEGDKADTLVARNNQIARYNGTTLIRLTSDEISEIARDVEVIINGTPCGMYGMEDQMAITEAQLAEMVNCNLIVESIYNPYETKLLEAGRLHGIKTVSGVELLVSQAMFSFTDAFDIELNASHAAVMKDAVLEYYLKNMR
jgi:shikimate dehydrogenase